MANSAVVSGLSSPTGPSAGDLWFYTGTSQLHVYDGTTWVPLHRPGAALSPTLGVGPSLGAGLTYLACVAGSMTGSVIPSLTGSTATPAAAAAVYDTTDNRLWVWNGSAWKSVALT